MMHLILGPVVDWLVDLLSVVLFADFDWAGFDPLELNAYCFD